MFKHPQTIPLKDPKYDRILISMIALMICSILLVGSSALFLTNLSTKWHNSVTHIATLEIPAGTSEKTKRKIEKSLENSSFIKEANKMNKEKIKAIIAPWLDQSILDSQDLPLPTIYSLSLSSGSAIERDKLKFSLKAIDENVKLETHKNWLNTAFKRAKTLKNTAWIIGGILVLTLVTSLSILTRSRILLNAQIINLLHTSGASDGYILKQFITYIISIAFKGLLIGSVLSVIILLILGGTMNLGTDLGETNNSLNKSDYTILILIPIIILGLMVLTTSRTVSSSLKKML